MRIETSQYEFSHRRKPRGFGNWWFGITYTYTNGQREHFRTAKMGLYAEARAEAVRQLRATTSGIQSVDVVEVLA